MFRCLNVAVAECAMSVKARAVVSSSSSSNAEKRSGGGDSKLKSDAVVTVLMRDGHSLELPRRLKCSELLASYPDHAVCHARALVMRQKGQRLAADSYLEQGRLYFLLPKPAGRRVRQKHGAETSGAGAARESGSSTLKLVISKQHLAQIIAEAQYTATSNVVSSKPHPQRPKSEACLRKAHSLGPTSAVKRARTRSHWSAPLDTIAEAASTESHGQSSRGVQL